MRACGNAGWGRSSVVAGKRRVQYHSIADAKRLPGLRLVLSMGVPAPWGESAKGIFHIKGIPFEPVGQHLGQENAELVAWTGIRQAPVAIFESEPPRHRWLDILMLAERLNPQPPLLPGDSHHRALVVGISNEICGEWGFAWCRRLMFFAESNPAYQSDAPPADPLSLEYQVNKRTIAAARPRIIAVLCGLTARLKAQHAMGSPYLVGASLTAADIYWACFAAYINPLPAAVNPMSDASRRVAAGSAPWLDAVKDPILFEHRDMMYARHLRLPLDF
jgi:glutathione S-transferase